MVTDQEPRYRLVDADGKVVGSLFAETDGTLKLQEGTSGNDNELSLTTQGALEVEQTSVSGVEQRATEQQVGDDAVLSRDANGAHFIFVAGSGDDEAVYATGFNFVSPIFEGPQMDNLSGQTATGTTGTDGSVTTFRDGNTIGLENRTGTNQTFFIFTIGD